MIAVHRTLVRETRTGDHIVNVTDELQELVRESGIRTGQATAMVVGSTASLTTLEFEPGLVNHDLSAALDKLAPEDARYEHEETWHDDNGHSHVRAALLGPSVGLPIVEGRIPLGTWQQVVLVNHDTRARRREVVVSLLGTG